MIDQSSHTIFSALLAPPAGHDCAGLTVVWPDDLRPFAMLFPWE